MKKIIALTALAAVVAAPASAITLVKNDDVDLKLAGQFRLKPISFQNKTTETYNITTGKISKSEIKRERDKIDIYRVRLTFIGTYYINSENEFSYWTRTTAASSKVPASDSRSYITITNKTYGKLIIGKSSINQASDTSTISGNGDGDDYSPGYTSLADTFAKTGGEKALEIPGGLGAANYGTFLLRGFQYTTPSLGDFKFAFAYGAIQSEVPGDKASSDDLPKATDEKRTSVNVTYTGIKDVELNADYYYFSGKSTYYKLNTGDQYKFNGTDLTTGERATYDKINKGLLLSGVYHVNPDFDLEASLGRSEAKVIDAKKYKDSTVESLAKNERPSVTLNHVGASLSYKFSSNIKSYAGVTHNKVNYTKPNKTKPGIVGKENKFYIGASYTLTKSVTLRTDAEIISSKLYKGSKAGQSALESNILEKKLFGIVSFSF